MNTFVNLKKKSFIIYGLGVTGISVLNYFKKKKIKNYFVWDDKKDLRKNFKQKNKIIKSSKEIDNIDYIVISPGIDINLASFSKKLKKNKKKIITDIDLLFLNKPFFKSIVVTGTNGKSTTCKMIEYLLKKNKFKVKLGGNIGKPVLDLDYCEKTYLVLEVSSFQLSYSKFIKPNYAIFLNFANDHLDWHGSKQKYLKSKIKIFQLQNVKDVGFLNKELKKSVNLKKIKSKIKLVNSNDFKKIKIKNDYLNSSANRENMSFVYTLSKVLKINKKKFISALESFKGLPHRYEIFYKKKNVIFINDSKATSFESTKFALSNNKNIFWILGGLPKYKDKFKLNKFKDNISKAYIIGNHTNYFKKYFKNRIDYSISFNLKKAIKKILIDIKNFNNKSVVLLSPSSASYDQFENFADRGNQFKKLVKFYVNRTIKK